MIPTIGSTDAILSIVNAGASVSAVDKDGLTALHCAASRGHYDSIEALIGLCGAEVDVMDNNGSSPLFYSVTLGHSECTTVLINKYGAKHNIQDNKGRRYVFRATHQFIPILFTFIPNCNYKYSIQISAFFVVALTAELVKVN